MSPPPGPLRDTGAAAAILNALANAAPKGSVAVSTEGGRVAVVVDLGEFARQLQTLSRPGGRPSTGDGSFPSAASPECTHCDGPALLQHLDLPSSTEVRASPETSAWIQPPATSGGREAVSAAARSLLAQASLVQDGLKMTTGQLQGLFEGGHFVTGATLTLPSSELAAMLLSHVVITGSPETVQTLHLAQATLSFLSQVPQGNAQLSKLISQMLSGGASPSAERMLKALSDLFGPAGLSGFQEVHELFKGLAEAAGKGSSSRSEGPEGRNKMQELSQTLALNSLPHMAGVAESQGAGLFQGLGQVFGSVLRGLAGMMMMNPQNQWPQALPPDQLLSEMATLFSASASKRADRDKKGKKGHKGPSRRRYPGHGSEEEREDEDAKRPNDPIEAYLEEEQVLRPFKPV